MISTYPIDGRNFSILKKTKTDEYIIAFDDKTYQFLTLVHHLLLSECQTESEYILNIDLQGENFGFYFGLYEIGKFKITNESKLEILNAFKIHYVDKGWAIYDDTLILSIRNHMNREPNSKNYSIMCFKWFESTKPEKVWELEPTYSLNALIKIKDDIVAFGYLNGMFELFSTDKMEILESKRIFDYGFSHMLLNDNKIYCSSMKGELACLTLDGELIWKKVIDDSKIFNVVIAQNKLHAITSNRRYFIIKPRSGEIFQQKEFRKELVSSFSSNFIFYEGSILISGDASIYSISKVGLLKILRSDDPLIRVLHSVSNGYLIGDDEGKLKLYYHSSVKFSKRRRAILLQ